MVDFKNLVGKATPVDFSDPLKLFESLDRKTSHTALRPAQRTALEEIGRRRSERDIVLKMPTGTGKSTVGLLFLRSHMLASKAPGVYLCPTIQLVEQVLEEATRLGIPAHHYKAREKHPEAEAMTGSSVIVCTYDKMFNAISTFNRVDVNITPCAIVLDDAHSGLEEIRDSFTLRIDDRTVLKKLVAILDGAGRTYSSGFWSDIKAGRGRTVLEIPYWLWRPLVDSVTEVLASVGNTAPYVFTWPFLREILGWCRCLVSADGIEVVPSVLPVQVVRAYTTAQHRLFMSATLADDSLLVRDLDCAAATALNPIIAVTDAGLGERMVLVPSLLDKSLDRLWVMHWCQKMASVCNVVVLSPSETLAREWEDFGAKVAVGAGVSALIVALREGTTSFAAFAQRYDGIDLPDDDCRVLVIDGLPTGEGITDRYDSHRPGVHAGVRNRLAYRIEQGMGRAVRSNADYAVIVLAGADLATFTAKTEVREAMSSDARAQIELGQTLAGLAKTDLGTKAKPEKALEDLAAACLNRDKDWKQYYDEQVRAKIAASPPPDGSRIEVAEAERAAANAAWDGDPAAAVGILRKALDAWNQKEPTAEGRLLQALAAYQLPVDPAGAMQTQKAAYGRNPALLRPPTGVASRPLDPGKLDSIQLILDWLGQFANANGAIASMQTLATLLSFGVAADRFEQALKDTSTILGAKGTRPDYELNEGPDNLWFWPEQTLIIEAKTEAAYAEIPKGDAEQLLHSTRWFAETYPNRAFVPILVAPTEILAPGVFLPEGARAVTPKLLEELVAALQEFVTSLAAAAASGSPSPKTVNVLLAKYELNPRALVQRFSTAPRPSKQRSK